MKRKILFRGDGNEQIGLGHLYRLLALAEMLKGSYEIIFVTSESSEVSVIPDNYVINKIPDSITCEQEAKELARAYKVNEYLIVADGYSFDSAYQKSIKEVGFTLVYIDDLAQEHMYADLVINHSPCVDSTNYASEDYTRFALGTDYSLLRPKFLEAARNKRKFNIIDTAFVGFGGADRLNLSILAARSLLKLDRIKTVHVVIGAANQNNDIYNLEKEYPGKLIIHYKLNEIQLLEVMLSCNFGIVPSSTICFELCCIKMPILAGFYVDNQKKIYNGFKKDGAIYGAGDFLKKTSEELQILVKELIENPISSHDLLMRNQKRLFDGYQKERMINLFDTL